GDEANTVLAVKAEYVRRQAFAVAVDREGVHRTPRARGFLVVASRFERNVLVSWQRQIPLVAIEQLSPTSLHVPRDPYRVQQCRSSQQLPFEVDWVINRPFGPTVLRLVLAEASQ